MREMRLTFLIIFLIAISIGSISATNISTIKGLWDIRNNLGGDYTLLNNLDLSVTNPSSITPWATGSTYSVGNIIENTDGYAYYCITANSDATFTPANWTKMWKVSKGWQPIGTEGGPFHGNFDGGGKIISNLYINRKADDPTNNTTLPPNGEDHVGL